MSDTRSDTVSAKAAQEFANQLSQVKSENPETDAEQYRLLLQLEEAYRAFALSKNSTDLEYVYAPGSERTDMDREQKTVTLYFPLNTDLSSLDLTAVPFGEAVVAAKLDAVDLTKEFKIPVYSKALNSYSFWTVKTVCGESTQQSSWSTLSGEYESVSTLHDGKTLLTANQLPYMNRMAANSGQVTTVVFEPVTDNIVDPFTLIFGSNTPDLKLDGKTVRENHFEIVTDGTSGILYEVAEGAKKQLSSFAFAVKPNAANTVRIALTPQNGKTLVNVWMNDILAVNSFANIANQSGFTGFYTPDFGIKISEFKNE